MAVVVLRCTPKPWFWLAGLVVYPLAGLLIVSILVLPAAAFAGLEIRPSEVRWTLGACTAVIALWGYTRDYKRAHFSLTSDALVLGREPWSQQIPFWTIESIVEGLPERQAWWLRVLRFKPGPHRDIQRLRANTALLRLQGRSLFALCLDYPFLDGGRNLLSEFIRVNQNKVVGPDS